MYTWQMLLYLLACIRLDTEGDTVDTGVAHTDRADDTDSGVVDTGPAGPTYPSVDGTDVTLLGLEHWGYAGSSFASVGDLDGDGAPEFIVGAHNENSSAEHSGSAYIVAAASLSAGSHALEEVGYRIAGNGSMSGAGHDVAGGADLDGDGVPDLAIVSAHNGYDNSSVYGVHVFWTPPYTAGGRGSVDDADFLFTCADSNWDAAATLAGDTDGDGRAELVVGCPGERMVYGVSASAAGVFGPGDAVRTLAGTREGFWLGARVNALGDVDGDGLDDLAVGGFNPDPLNGPGHAWIVVDHSAGAHDLPDVSHELQGDVGDFVGYSFADLGDADGDGLSDVWVGGAGSGAGGDYVGAAVLVAGAAWTAGGADALADVATLVAYGTPDESGGGPLARAGDVDGDGAVDLLIGAPHADAGAGGAWVLHGPFFAGSVTLDGAADRIRGGEAGDYAGIAVAGLGDINLDGLDDIAIGATNATTAETYAGKTYLLFGE